MPDIDVRALPAYEAPTLSSRDVLDLILRLDSSVNPGLTWAQLRALVARCDGCGLVMTRRVFQTLGAGFNTIAYSILKVL